ncbi:MAG: hypothetical protein IT371_05310 [Deltaproteobacteria bacterium]|nr:hypothetical protein [Deltaproteobacteria bacterium]
MRVGSPVRWTRPWLCARRAAVVALALTLDLALGLAPGIRPAEARGDDAARATRPNAAPPSLWALGRQALGLRFGLWPAGTRAVHEPLTDGDRRRYAEGSKVEVGWFEARPGIAPIAEVRVSSDHPSQIAQPALQAALYAFVGPLAKRPGPHVVRFTHTHPGSFWRRLLDHPFGPLQVFSREDKQLGTWVAHRLAEQGLEATVEMAVLCRDLAGRVTKRVVVLPPPLHLGEPASDGARSPAP